MSGDELRRLGRVDVHGNSEEVAQAAAAFVAAESERAIAERGAFSIALAGGATPKRCYEILASSEWRDRVRWEAWRVYFGDERAVPPDDEQSNYKMAADALLRHVDVPGEHVHRMRGEIDPLQAALEYHDVLAETLPRADSGVPRFDLVMLGMGTNGHTASLFPGTPALEVRSRWAARGLADYAPFERITLTFPVFNAARTVVFTVTGAKKHDALHATAVGSTPAAQVRPRSGNLHWLLDTEAAEGDGGSG